MTYSVSEKAGARAIPARPFWLVMVVLVLAEIVAAMESSMIYAALPRFYQVFDNPIGVGWVLTAYMLVSASFAALCSRLGDLYGRRRMLLLVLALAGFGSVISAVSHTLGGVITGRAIQGAAGAILPLCLGLAREHVPGHRLAFAVSIIGSAIGVGGSMGLLFGGVVIDLLEWQWLFWISSGFAAGVWLLVLVALPHTRPARPTQRLDVWGGVLLAPGIAALLIGFSMASAWGWTSARTLGLTAAGALVLWVWARHELRHPQPLINVRLLGNRQVALANTAFFMLAFGAMNVQVLMVLLQQPSWTGAGLGLSATMSGMLKLPSIIFAVIAGAVGGFWATRYGGRAALLLAVSVCLCAWVGLTLNHFAVWIVVVLFLVNAFGATLAQGAVANLVVEATPADRTSEATGLMQVIRYLGMAIGSQVMAVLMASSTIANPALGPGRFPSAQAYVLTIGAVACFTCLSLVIAWMLPRRNPATFQQPAIV